MSDKWVCQKRIFKDTWIRNLKSENNMQITDGTVPGLYLRYSRYSGKISFFLSCSAKGTKKRCNLFLGKLYDFDTIEDVRIKAREVRSAIGARGPITIATDHQQQSQASNAVKYKYDDLFKEYMEKYAKLYKKPSTQNSNKDQYRLYIQPIFGNMFITDIEERHVLDAYAKWATDTSFSTANKALSLVSDFWKWCEARKYVPRNSNPCSYVKKGTNPKYKPQVLDSRGYKALFNAMDNRPKSCKIHPIYFRALKVLALTGCRSQEIRHLLIEEVSLEEKVIHLKDSKTGPRDVKLADAVIPELEFAITQAKVLGSKYVFPSVQDPNKGLNDVLQALHWALKRAGLPQMRVHDLRHSFITMGANMGESMLALRDAAGHSRITTTEGYSHLADAATYKAVNNITDQMFAG